MSSITKTDGIDVLAHQLVTHPGSVVGSAQNVATKLAARVIVFHALVEAVANVNPGVFLIQLSGSPTGNEDWVTEREIELIQTAAAATETLTAVEPIGETVLAVASTTGFAAEDIMYIQDTGTLANSEWARLKTLITDTSLSLLDGLTRAKGAADIAWNKAEIKQHCIDLTAVKRLRVVFQHERDEGANVHVKALMVTGDTVT